MLELRNINIAYGQKECMRNSHFIAYPYQITGIYGESGTGKSSLLYMITMLSNQQCDYYFNQELLCLTDDEKNHFRENNITFITQDSLVIDTLNVEENIQYHLLESNSSYSVDELLDKVHLKHKRKAYPKSLSGGERQRIALICALARDASMIVGDEVSASLDEDNKVLVMKLLREEALKGKIVILVSHEKQIIEQCDRLYELVHLQLQLKKESQTTLINTSQNNRKQIKLLQLYKHLFQEQKRNKIPVLFIILLTLLFGISIIRNSHESSKDLEFTMNDLSDNKILVINDENQEMNNTQYGVAIRSIGFKATPLNKETIETIKNLDYIENIYPYYFFESKHKEAIHVYRNNEKIQMNKDASDVWNSSIPEYFTAVPIYQEELELNQEGVYVCSQIAKKYNIQVGDQVVLFLEVPVAIADCVKQYYDRELEMYIGYDNYLSSLVEYEANVLGFMESNSFQNEIYMQYKDMKSLLEQVQTKYKEGKIKVSVDDYYGDYRIIDYNPSALSIFVDDYSHVLNVMNNIKKQTKDTFVYSEYIEVASLIENSSQIYKDAMKIGVISSLFFIIGASIIMIIYVSRNKSLYMMLKLIGKKQKIINRLFMMHIIKLIITLVLLSLPIYISASLPNILPYFNIITYEQIMTHINETYLYYYAYFKFSLMHAFGLILSILFIGIIGYYSIIRYKKYNIIDWLRGKTYD